MTDPLPTVPPEAVTAAAEAMIADYPVKAETLRLLAVTALEAAAPLIRAAAVKEERERWCRIEPDPEQPGYNRGVFDISGFAAEVVAGERDAIRAQVYAEIRSLLDGHEAIAAHCDECKEPVAFADLIPGGETDE